MVNYRVPGEVHHILLIWGRSKYLGKPRLSYPAKAAAVGDYTEKGYKVEPPAFDVVQFDRLCEIIDNLPKHQQDTIRLRYREKFPRRKCIRILPEYEKIFEKTCKRIVFLLDSDLQ